MKLKITAFFFFISLHLAAQPDNDFAIRRFEKLTEELKKDPNNYD